MIIYIEVLLYFLPLHFPPHPPISPGPNFSGACVGGDEKKEVQVEEEDFLKKKKKKRYFPSFQFWGGFLGGGGSGLPTRILPPRNLNKGEKNPGNVGFFLIFKANFPGKNDLITHTPKKTIFIAAF